MKREMITMNERYWILPIQEEIEDFIKDYFYGV